MSSICLLNPNDVNKTFDIAMFVGQTVETVRSGFFSESKYICARFKNYEERLDNNAVIGDWINEIVQNNIGKYDVPETFIYGQNDDNPNYSIALTPKSKHELSLPKIYVPITEELYKTGTVQSFLDETKKFVTIDHNFISLQASGQSVDNNIPISDLLNLAKTSGLVYNFEFTSSGEERAIKRNSIAYELYETEKKYINQLTTIIDFWKPKFLRSAFFTQAEMKILFDEIPAVLKAQQAFYDDYSAYKIDYCLSVFPIIMRHIDDFKVATHVIAYQQEITDLMNKKAKDSRILKLIKQLAEEQNGIEFLSFMIATVQRIPRYMLFVKELIKNSPPFHPDYFRANFAKQLIDDLSKHVDIATKKANRELKLQSIQSNLTSKYVILKPERNLINCWNVIISDKQSTSATFYVFNDIILLIRNNNNKNYTVIYETDIYSMHFSYINEQTFKLHHETPQGMKFMIIQFDNQDRFTEFFATIDACKDKYLLKSGNGYNINWEVLQTSIEFPPACDTSCVLYDKTFIFFGGQRTDERNPTSMLTAIKLSDLTCVEITSIANGRYGHTVSIDEGKLYIIGGKNKMMEFTKFLSYNFLQQTWSQLLLNGAESFTARYGHTTTPTGSNFIIFGGRTPSGQVLDDLIVFDPVRNSLTSVNPPGGRPPARYRHTVVIVGDHLFLHGGKTGKEFLSDTWMLDLKAMVWQRVSTGGESLPPRACHSMAVIGTSILIIGGKSSNPDDVLATYTIDSETFECHKVLDVGNVPHSLRKAAYTYDGSYIYLYGGLEKRTKTPSNILYKISLGQTWANRANLLNARHAAPLIPKKRRQSLIPKQSLFASDDIDFEEIVQLTKTSAYRHQQQRNVQSVVEKKIISSSVKPSNDDVAAMMTGPGDYVDDNEDDFEEEEEEEDNDGMEFSDDDEDEDDEGNLDVFALNPAASSAQSWKPSAEVLKERKKMDPSRPIMEVLTELLTGPVDQPAGQSSVAKKPKISVLQSSMVPSRKGAFMQKRNSMVIKK